MARPIRAASVLDEALSFFKAGRLEEALASAERAQRERRGDAAAAAVLAARVDLRTGEVKSAIARLNPLFRSGRRATVVATLLGIAHFRLGDRARGLHLIEGAFRDGRDALERSEAAYYRAWAAYSDRDLDVADRWVALALDESVGIVYVRTLALSGWITEARADYAVAARAFRLALNALRTVGERDDELVARILHSLSVYAAELFDHSLASFVSTQAARFDWPASALLYQFYTVLNLALAAASDGDIETALDGLERAALLAVNRPILVAEATLESAELYRLLGEMTAARRGLRQAADALRTVEWQRTDINNQMVLLECACAAARIDVSAASEWLARYSATPKKDAGWLALTSDPRVKVLELHARALVECAVGNAESGIRRLREVEAAWESLGYVRREAYAAADLANQGDVDARGRLAILLRTVPAHPLRTATADVPEKTSQSNSVPVVAVALSPAERRVLDGLVAGMSVRDMAKAWDRSEFTIRNHLKRLFAKFAVRSSAALVAKALTRP